MIHFQLLQFSTLIDFKRTSPSFFATPCQTHRYNVPYAFSIASALSFKTLSLASTALAFLISFAAALSPITDREMTASIQGVQK
jgi:hypothetical protein